MLHHTTIIRCDARACPAVPLVFVTRTDGQGETRTLSFCGHHYDQREDALFLEGWTIATDARPDLKRRERRLI